LLRTIRASRVNTTKARVEAMSNLLAAASDRVTLFHPVGIPAARHSHEQRDRGRRVVPGCRDALPQTRNDIGRFGRSRLARPPDGQRLFEKRAAFRRALMATKMAIPAPGAASPSADWLRLGHPQSAFELVTDWLSQGGLGRIQPLWAEPSDTTVLPATDDMADPDGSNGSTFIGLFASLIAEAGN
jgi:hypothetical protein